MKKNIDVKRKTTTGTFYSKPLILLDLQAFRKQKSRPYASTDHAAVGCRIRVAPDIRTPPVAMVESHTMIGRSGIPELSWRNGKAKPVANN